MKPQHSVNGNPVSSKIPGESQQHKSAQRGTVSGSSRRRFRDILSELRAGRLEGSIHRSTPSRRVEDRTRTAGQLISQFFSLLRPRMAVLVFSLLTVTLSTILGLIPPAGTKFIVDNVLNGQPLPPALQEIRYLQNPINLLIATVVLITIVYFLRISIHLCGRWQITLLSNRLTLDVRGRLFDQILRLPLHRIHELRSGAVSALLREDGGSVGQLIFGLLYNPWRAIVQLLGSLLILAWVDWTLLLGALLLLPLVYFSHRTWINSVRPQFRAIRDQRARTDAGATESFAGIRIVRGFSRQTSESLRYMQDNNLLVRQELHAWWWMRVVEVFWEFALPIGSSLLLFYGGYQVLQGNLTAGELMMFMVYLLLLLEPLGTLSNGAIQLQNSLSGLDRVLDLLAEPREMIDNANTVRLQRNSVRGGIEFCNVSFSYPATSALTLSDISLRIAPGQTVALVGPSGAGKTTICNLVARFYDPTAGQILLDGRDLRDYDVESFRSILGVVEQDVFLFDGTIARNIAYGRRKATPEQIRAAADAANATEFIDRMPAGFQTLIGERGVRLSGGQRQRLAIARAILADPALLILDEATSNLDTESEHLIQKSLQLLTAGRTCFVIAHRLSTIADADLICVIEEGRVTQTGTHFELMQSLGRYRSMVEQQISLALGEHKLSTFSPVTGNSAAPVFD